jgi:hypothetical protein
MRKLPRLGQCRPGHFSARNGSRVGRTALKDRGMFVQTKLEDLIMSVTRLKKTGDEPGTPRIAIVVVLLLLAGIIGLIIFQGLTRPVSSTQAGSVLAAQVTQQVTPGQPSTVSVGTITVYLPANATSQPVTVAITPREPNLYQAAGETGWSRPQVINVELRDPAANIQPNVTFSQPAEVCFQLTAAQWSDYTQNTGNYQIQYYDESLNPPHWVALPLTTHPQQAQLCGQTMHFSLFALAVRAQVGVPVTGATPFPTPKLYAP